jgi:hypothetical protein
MKHCLHGHDKVMFTPFFAKGTVMTVVN